MLTGNRFQLFSITREEFQQIAENIVKLLPKETAECYYTPSLGSVQVQGKLYTAYSGLKAKLRDVGLIGKRPKSKPGDRLCLVPEPSTGMLIDNTVQSETELNCTSMSKPGNTVHFRACLFLQFRKFNLLKKMLLKRNVMTQRRRKMH